MDQLRMYRGSKDAADAITQPLSETRPWGKWSVINQGEGYKVKLLEVSPGHRLSLQYHHLRAEHWVVVQGRARVVVGARTRELSLLQSVVIPPRTAHRVENPGSEPLRLVEVQHGEQLLEEDIVRLDDDYRRGGAGGTEQ